MTVTIITLLLQALGVIFIYFSIIYMGNSDLFWPIIGLANVCSLAIVVIMGMTEVEESEETSQTAVIEHEL